MAEWVTAGKVRMTPRGTYSPYAPYAVLDLVRSTDGSKYYIAKKAVPAGTALTNTEYFEAIVDVSSAIENASDAVEYIAPTETSPAESAHVVGEFIIYDGNLYSVKSAISVGDTLTVGTNITLITGGFTNDLATNLIKAQGTQPTEATNKVWFDTSEDTEVTLPEFSDFEALEEEVTDLQNAMGIIDINNPNNWGEGCFNIDGSIYIPSDMNLAYKYTVPFIPVFPGETITMKMSTATGNAKWARWIFYDANKNVVGYGVQNQTWTPSITTTIQIPGNAEFWRVCFRQFNDSTFAISYSHSNDVVTELRNYTNNATAFDSEFVYPVKWRHALISNGGTTYGSIYGATTDFLIPTAMCDTVVALNADYEISVAYYKSVNGRPVFEKRSARITDAHNIDKTYSWFAVVLFGSWSTALDLAACDTIAQITSAIDNNAESIFAHQVPYQQPLNTSDIWSVCHQGYDADTLSGRSKRGGYAEAARRGFTHGECDVKLTSDGKLVCCHDNSFVDATTGNTITISSHTLSELQTYDYYGSIIATLDEIIVECRNNGLKLFIDQVDSANVSAVCDTVSEYNAWNMCTFVVGYNDSYPDLAPFIVNAIHSYNGNASIAIVTYVTGYTAALQYALTLSNAIIYVGQYAGQIEVVKAIAAATSGKLRLMLWTVDFLHAYLSDALPYIDGYTSNVWSGRDVFNPTINAGL